MSVAEQLQQHGHGDDMHRTNGYQELLGKILAGWVIEGNFVMHDWGMVITACSKAFELKNSFAPKDTFLRTPAQQYLVASYPYAISPLQSTQPT